MFFLNPKKVKAENPTPRWFSGLMVLFFAFVMYRALYPADAPKNNDLSAGERLLEEMPSLKRVVNGETFEAATDIMEERALEAQVEAQVEKALEGDAPEEIANQEVPETSQDALTVQAAPHETTANHNANAARFSVSARNGSGELVDIVFESDDGALTLAPNQERTLVLPPENGGELRIITIKRID